MSISNELISIILSTLVSYLLIFSFYRLFKSGWPNLYFGFDDNISLFISLSPVRFFCFRFFPIFVAINLAIFSLGSHLNIVSRIVIGILSVFIYELHSDIRAFLQLIKNSKKIKIYINKHTQIAKHIFSFLFNLSTGFISAILSTQQHVKNIFPQSLQEIRGDIWSAIFTAFLFILVTKILENSDKSDYAIFKELKKKLDKGLVSLIRKTSKIEKADYKLVLAVCIVENMQRPKWIRFIERLKSLIIKEGSYGIMQVKSGKYIDDKTSIKIAIKKYFKITKYIKELECGKIRKEIISVVMKYNPDQKYASNVADVYCHI